MERYSHLIKKTPSDGGLNTIDRYYRSLTLSAMEQKVQQFDHKVGGHNVTGFDKELCQWLETLSLKDVP